MRGKKSLGIMAFVLTAGFAAGGCSSDNEENEVVGDAAVTVTFGVIDTDHDGDIEQSEWNAALVTFDVNGDGVLSRAEFPLNATTFATFDTNGDGVISVAEWDAGFTVLEVDHNGIVTETEFDAFL